MLSRSACFLVILIGGLCLPRSVHAQSAPPVTRPEPYSYRDVVKRVLPAVVSITSKKNRNVLNGIKGSEGGESPDLRKFIEGLEPKKPQPRNENMTIGFGSGFVVDAKGVVMTNYHVIENADVVEITFEDGHKIQSKDLKGDKRTDLAIIRFEPVKDMKLAALSFADSSLMEVGDRVLAFGAPFGLSGSVTSGIISAKGRDVELNIYDDFLQTDAAINPGNSGGPLVNLDGKVVGVNSAIKSGSGGFQGVSFAISSDLAQTILVPLIRDGIVKRPYMGIRFTSTRPRDREEETQNGVVVTSVINAAPAAKGGIQPKDVIVTINGIQIKKDRDLTKAIASQRVGASIEVGVIRDGKPKSLRLTLEEEPKDFMTTQRSSRPSGREGLLVSKAGLQLSTLSEDLGERLGITSGAVVVGVIQGSVADRAGVVPGSIILSVNNRSVESAEDAKTMIEESIGDDGATLQIQNRDGRIVSVLLQSR